MNRNLLDYDIETDPVAKLYRGFYWCVWHIMLPIAILGIICYIWIALTFKPKTGLETAEEEKIKVEKRIEALKTYYQY